MNNQVRLRAESISCTLFSSHQPFFEHINITISQGLTFITGKNGVGKSTLLRLISGNCASFKEISGRIFLQNQEYSLADESSCQALYHVTMKMRQDTDSMVAKNCTGAENLAGARMPFFPSLAGFSTKKAPELAALFSLPLSIPAFQLSGGQRQMLALLMAVQKPVHLLLLDEPTAALDEKNADLVMDFLHQLIMTYNITVLCISHDYRLTKKYGGQTYLHLEEKNGKRIVDIRSF